MAWDHGAVAQELMPDADAASPWEQADLLSLVAQPAARVLPEPQPSRSPELVSPPAEPGGPQRLLILDTETTGLNPLEDQCIEVGAVLFDVPRRSVLSQVSFLLPCERNPAQGVNGIDPVLTQQPQPWQNALSCLLALAEAADLLVAHNAAFDRQWFGVGMLPDLGKPWLCSMEDIRWPADRQLRSTPSVRDLALAYGVPVWAAHRALTDCIYVAHVFERCADLETLLRQGLEPRRLYRARLSYEERHKAREAGFRWNEPVSGAWSRKLSEREAELLPFPVVPVDEPLLPRSA
jgi:DNA polymerase-3 subunit epsilon